MPLPLEQDRCQTKLQIEPARSTCVCLQVMYSEFLTLVHSGNVRTAGIDDQADKIYFSLNGHSSQQSAEAAETASTQPEASVAAVDSTSGETASVLCCAALCCAVLCCAVLCCAVLDIIV